MPIQTGQAGQGELEAVRRLYAEAAYGAAIGADDTVIVARSGDRIVGAVRLCPEEGITVLRGMQVAPAFQRQGIGAVLLAACRPYLDRREAFCLPYAHLVPFYAASGFQPAHGAELPHFLAQRLASYLAKGQDVLAMRRPTS